MPGANGLRTGRNSALRALGSILDLEAVLKLDGLDVSIGCNPAHRLDIAGVSVTVMPDLLVHGAGRNGEFLGALKFRYGKTNPISPEWAAYMRDHAPSVRRETRRRRAPR